MAGAKRIRNVTFNTGRITSKIRGVKKQAMTQIAREMERDLQKTISIQGTPKTPSAPGQPPKKQTGFLHDRTKVVYRNGKIVVRTPQYGIWLDSGTSRMLARPFIHPRIRLRRRNWERRTRVLMRRILKTK